MSERDHRRIGFIGLGKMGLPMATKLVEAGHSVAGFDSDPTQCRAMADHGGRPAASANDVAHGNDVLITMLPNETTVRSVLLGTDGEGAASHLNAGAIVIDMSSSRPAATRETAKHLRGLGIEMVDAPVSGGVKRAQEGSLTIMVGGEEAAIARVEPILQCMGRAIVPAGPLGAGHAIKALNNYVSAAGLAAMSEALLAAQAFGIEPATVIRVLNTSTGRNNSTETKAEPFILSGTFDSGFAMNLMAKDLGIADQLADDLHLNLPMLAWFSAFWSKASDELGEGADHTEVFRFLRAHLEDSPDA